MICEIGIQPNCSELVVRFSYSSDKQALRELEQITGWKLGILYFSLKRMLAVPIDLSKTKVERRGSTFHIDLQDILDERVLYYMLKHDITPRDLYQRTDNGRLSLIRYRRPTFARQLTWDIDIKCSDQFIHLEALQDAYTPHFKPLVRVLQAKQDATWWVSHGGDQFFKWCKDRGLEELIVNNAARIMRESITRLQLKFQQNLDEVKTK